MIPEILKAMKNYENPFLGAFKKGLIFELKEINPYFGPHNQRFSNKKTWKLYFYRAFEHGRSLKKKYKLFEQMQIF